MQDTAPWLEYSPGATCRWMPAASMRADSIDGANRSQSIGSATTPDSGKSNLLAQVLVEDL